MKKSTIILTLLASCSAFAGETTTEPDIIPPAEKKTLTLSVQGGLMHTDAANATITSTFDVFQAVAPGQRIDTNTQMVPTVLYGFTIGAEKNLTSPGQSKYFHSVGMSVGYYTGDKSSYFNCPADAYSDHFDPSLTTEQSSVLSAQSDVSVDMIPIILTYNLQYEATESLYFYAGVRGGVVIRNTDVSGRTAWFGTLTQNGQTAVVDKSERFDDSSTKVLPTLGLGIGMRAYMTEKLAVDLSYDFGWTFGDDCDDIVGSEGSVLPGTSESGRYYGTLKAGVSYSF